MYWGIVGMCVQSENVKERGVIFVISECVRREGDNCLVSV